jgi:hypothetical protein
VVEVSVSPDWVAYVAMVGMCFGGVMVGKVGYTSSDVTAIGGRSNRCHVGRKRNFGMQENEPAAWLGTCGRIISAICVVVG